MAAYDPKRPRPSTHDEEEPAPVEALLDPEPELAVEPEAAAEPEAVEVDLRVPSSNGSGPKVASEVPVAAAPEEGTANRAVVAAALGAAGLVALLVAILLRRRRRVD
jgi:hypothetical protein